jgi:pimeloyl-ACP methyl ester carboxylesterase
MATSRRTDMEPHAGVVQSADGTGIALERSGSGPAVVMIDPAGGYSGFDNIRGLGALLSAEFTVYTYDRRGRGKSARERALVDRKVPLGTREIASRQVLVAIR